MQRSNGADGLETCVQVWINADGGGLAASRGQNGEVFPQAAGMCGLFNRYVDKSTERKMADGYPHVAHRFVREVR